METEQLEFYEERYQLIRERIQSIQQEKNLKPEFQIFFERTSQYLLNLMQAWDFVGNSTYSEASLETLREWNRKLYAPALKDKYEESFLNPAYAVHILGEEFGQQLSFLASELFAMIPFVFERKLFDMVIRMELFVEVFHAFSYAWEEEKGLPAKEEIGQILYWFMSDYQELACEQRIGEQLGVEKSVGEELVCNADLTDLRYLYRYGEYVTLQEEKLAEYLNSLPEEDIQGMADTFTEGYRMGFLATNKDITKKKTVAVYYQLGFERMMRKAAANFAKMGLRTIFFRAAGSALDGRSLNKNGFFGASCNKQYEYDHNEDAVLYMDKAFVNRRLEAMKNAYEKYKEEAAVYGGPAVVEVFGETPFAPEMKKEVCKSTETVQKLKVEYAVQAGDLVNRYIKGEERSFTIIAFPVPAIGGQFEEIFKETVRMNTLDYTLYRDLQQTLIDALNRAEYVEIKGMNGNRTDLRVALHKLESPEKETNFENCVADVNIPVGEVFTSPRLAGTDGTLHVKRVFLNELEYRDLEITLKNGQTDTYGCGNFDTKEEGQRYIREHVLYHHASLPLGEFAIGTNTTAYVMAKRFGIEDKLPILIAEKMGPHFALGDTCYSHAEDVTVYNPDGREIVAKDNEISLLRKTDRSKAYFNCHTDITIPYEELGELTAVCPDSSRIPILSRGRFVLPGLGELNVPLDEK